MVNPVQWAQGAFQIPANATPEQIKRKREILAEMILGQGRPQYVGEGLADGVAKAFAGWQTGKVNKFESEARQKANDAFTAMLGQTPAGPLSVLGMDPSWGGATPFVEPGAPEQTPSTFGITPGAAPGAAAPASAFMDSLVRNESGGDWSALNSEGYGGRLQFGKERLADAAAAGLVPQGTTGADFSRMPPQVQQAVEQWHFADIDRQADRLGITKHLGQNIGGVTLTPDAIRAMAHLGGIGGVQKFVQSGGQYNPADSNGTRLTDYGTRHGAAGGPGAAMAGFQVPAMPAYNGPPVAALRAALANPWLDDASKQVAAQMLEEAERASDPMQQIQMQQAQMGMLRDQAELAQMGQPEQMTPYQQAQIDLAQQRLALDQQGGGGQTEYGLTPQYGVDESGNPVLIQIGKDGTATQTAMPEGVAFQKEPIRIDAGTHWVLLDPITRQPVGQVQKEIAEAAAQGEIGKAQGANEAAAIAGLPDAIAQADQAIALATAIRDDPALPSITGMVQGRIPPLGQAATDLNVKIEQARGKVFVEAFEGLKGGGAITEREGEAATRAIARMDRVQSHGAYVEALNELIGIVEQGRRRAMEKAGVQTPPAPEIDDDDALLRKYGG